MRSDRALLLLLIVGTTACATGATDPIPVRTDAASEASSEDTGEPGSDTEAPDSEAPDTNEKDTSVPDTSVPDTEAPDTGTIDTGAPDTLPFDTGTTDTGTTDTGGDTGVVTDKTTGLVCSSDATCDVTGDGYAYCTNSLYVVGPLNPTAVCMQLDPFGGDVCTPTTATSIYLCDSGMGLCVKSGTNPATCEPMCTLEASGTWSKACAGKNACIPEIFGTDSAGKVTMYGTCQGGCAVDSDCPSGSKCDPLQKFCAKTCSSDTTCKSGWSSAPANWKCDLTRGACTFTYPKTVGSTCSTANDCLCLKKSTATSGYCTSVCKTGTSSACPVGFTCDALLPAKDSTGKAMFTFATQPAGLSGYCVKNCTTATECGTGMVCEASAGLTQKTCRPAP